MKDKVSALIDIFNKAYGILIYTLENPENEFIKYSAFEKFEFTSNLFWKTIWLCVELEGKKTNTIETCLKEAKKLKLIEDEKLYFEIFNSKDYIMEHLDNGDVYETYLKINDYSKLMKNTMDKLNSDILL